MGLITHTNVQIMVNNMATAYMLIVAEHWVRPQKVYMGEITTNHAKLKALQVGKSATTSLMSSIKQASVHPRFNNDACNPEIDRAA